MTDRIYVTLTGPVRQEMKAAAKAASPRETGGLLLGWWDDQGGVVIIRHAIEVPDRQATHTSWTRRQVPANRALAQALKDLNHPLLGYVGDWHVHPEQVGASWCDRASITETSKQYDQAIVLIVRLPDDSLDILAARHGSSINASLIEGDKR